MTRPVTLAETVPGITWRVLVFSDPAGGLAPFAVWEASRGEVTAAGADPRQGLARLLRAEAAEAAGAEAGKEEEG